jgi:bifunctional non-homologous end joining protein LigD
MGLQKYIQKRDFKKTTEPPGKIKQSSAGNRFFIQKHAASHLHFDFRLEYNGVLKSWAVPKGPSVSAKVKRLAMEVEDHPLDYGDFEGTIPKGEYGGGTVMLWDEGTWTPENDPKLGFKKGHLAFSLKGKRLKGRWDLVRTHQPDGKKNMWFLIHKKESGASGPEPVETKMTSVTTHRTMEQIAKGNKVWHSDKKKERIAVAKLFQLPENFKPQPWSMMRPAVISGFTR